MALGTNFTGLAQDRTAIPTGSYAVLIGDRSDFTLTTTTYGEVTVSSVAGSNLYQIGYISQENIEVGVEGDKKVNIGAGNQEVNISYGQKISFDVNQADSLDEKALQEIEDTDCVVLIVALDSVVVTTATLASNGNISTGNMKYLFDHCFLMGNTTAKGGERKSMVLEFNKTNQPVRYANMAEGILQTIS